MGLCKKNTRVYIRPLQLRISPEKVFSLFSFLSFSYKRNDWELPLNLHHFECYTSKCFLSFSCQRNNREFSKGFHNLKFYRGKGFSLFLFHLKRNALPLMKYLKIFTSIWGFICMLKINT